MQKKKVHNLVTLIFVVVLLFLLNRNFNTRTDQAPIIRKTKNKSLQKSGETPYSHDFE
jgi:hypothetical protein